MFNRNDIRDNISPEELATMFLKDYFNNKEISYPINPFEMLKENGVNFFFRPFKKYEGIYLQEDDNGSAIVGININRPITRQRYTAAHELCHHIKDAGKNISCLISGKSEIEKFAEAFAAGLLMPLEELNKQVCKFEINGHVDFESVLKIANYFGVSFESCLYRIAYKLHKIEGDTSPMELKKRISKFKPKKMSQSMGLNDLRLYEQLFDTNSICLFFEPNEFSKRIFQTEYIFNDSRMEGINIGIDIVAQIITDIKLKNKNSEYFNCQSEEFIEVAGLCEVYSEVFDKDVPKDISVFDMLEFHRKLYAYAPYPEEAGKFRNTNNFVSDAKFETSDKNDIYNEFLALDEIVKDLVKNISNISKSEYIKQALNIHYKLTTIHPFNNGNGRISRAFLNLLLIKNNIPPVFFTYKNKSEYKEALKNVDVYNDSVKLYELTYKNIIEVMSTLTNMMI
ncbi:MAG: ImmA/IrrE family metallo-endopeptidase [Clostridiales bacterium]|nr:ImmA/IrrE family metallo-endopeptidase [Clostridiales bacterium]